MARKKTQKVERDRRVKSVSDAELAATLVSEAEKEIPPSTAETIGHL